jgi:hypothetical protein
VPQTTACDEIAASHRQHVLHPVGVGAVGIVATEHVLPRDDDSFFVNVQRDYEEVVPEEPSTKAGAPKHPDAIPDLSAEFDASGCFHNVASRRYVWAVSYAADEYIGVLDTSPATARSTRSAGSASTASSAGESKPAQSRRCGRPYLATLNLPQRAEGSALQQATQQLLLDKGERGSG